MSNIQTPDEMPRRSRPARASRNSIHLDMTPMVDLAFLLLTFFILTTSLTQPGAMDLSMPGGPPSNVPAAHALTVLLAGNDKVYWYEGPEETLHAQSLQRADYSATGPLSLHRLLNARRSAVTNRSGTAKDSVMRTDSTSGRLEASGLTVLIKSSDDARYQNLVDVLDEMLVCSISRYALVDLTDRERTILATRN